MIKNILIIFLFAVCIMQFFVIRSEISTLQDAQNNSGACEDFIFKQGNWFVYQNTFDDDEYWDKNTNT